MRSLILISLISSFTSFVIGDLMYYEYNSQIVKWTHAEQICAERNGSLLTMESFQKQQDIYFLLVDSILGTMLTSSDVWLGLHAVNDPDDCSETLWEWSNTNSLGNWTNWDTSEPKYCHKEHCTRLVIKNMRWRATRCYGKKTFICQIRIEDQRCVFKKFKKKIRNYHSHTNAFLMLTIQATSLDECQRICLDSAISDGSACSIIDVSSNGTSCNLYFMAVSSRYLVLYGLMNTKDTEFYFKMCDIDEYPSTTPTMDDSTPTTGSPSVINPTDQPVPASTASPITKTTKDFQPFNNSEICQVNSTWDAPNLTMKDIKRLITELRTKLSIAKTSTTLFKRKLISVYDERPSSVGIGLVGSTILLVIFGLIVLSDCRTFYKTRRKVKIRIA